MRFFSRLLKSLFILSAVLSFLVAGPACVYASGGGSSHGKTKDESKNEAKSKKKESVTITGGLNKDDPIFLHLAPLTLPVINDHGAQQLVTMLIDLQLRDIEAARKMQIEMPRVKDAVLQALYGGLSDGSMRNANALNIVQIKQSVHETVDRVFGSGHVIEVLIQAVAQRKL